MDSVPSVTFVLNQQRASTCSCRQAIPHDFNVPTLRFRAGSESNMRATSRNERIRWDTTGHRRGINFGDLMPVIIRDVLETSQKGCVDAGGRCIRYSGLKE